MTCRHLAAAAAAVAAAAVACAGCGDRSGPSGGAPPGAPAPSPTSGASADDHGDDYGSATDLGALEVGQRTTTGASGVLERVGDFDYFVVTLRRGVRYHFGTSSAYDTRLRVIGPNGTTLADNDDDAPQAHHLNAKVSHFEPRQDGPHYLVVNRGAEALDRALNVAPGSPDMTLLGSAGPFQADAPFAYGLVARLEP